MSEPESTLKPADKAALWWRELQDTRGGKPNPRADRAALARLRRARPDELPADETIMDLYRRLFSTQYRLDNMVLAMRVALVLAHVREDRKERVGPALGAGGENAPLKPLRLKRLLQAEANDEIVRQFRRAVDLLDGAANVRDLADLLLNWTDEDRAADYRARFAFGYFGAAASAGDAPDIHTADA
ncbi:type I-E CRISPR-associated protein Cse2/CasB [Oryzibacter oryziterrae]|uniref:type I-E CRISPR-associated protein Cse2/CasB n=1 Tax=Oryzibacter oryziterrae TaxID=2766474 RepID=UPI001F022F66|nr:type I-E CRISPR-associated protein Cse2/CasB [Oryzibacter oryziterrae]